MASKIGAQLYTVRDFTKTPGDIATTLKKIRKIGYENVQVSALGKIEPAELAKMLKEEGLQCGATHISIDRMKNETQAVIDEHAMWNCKYTAVGGFFPKKDATVTTQTWVDFAEDYSKVAEKLADAGLLVGYHNHSHEFSHWEHKPALQILFEHFHPAVWMEVDCYWVTHGGGDPAAWIRKFAKRVHCVHMKDMVVDVHRTQFMAEVGEGNLNWPNILAALKEANADYYFVEQDICQRDPFDCLETSYKNLKEMGVE